MSSYLVPAIRPQYFSPSSRLLRETAVISFTYCFRCAPLIGAYRSWPAGSGTRTYAASSRLHGCLLSVGSAGRFAKPTVAIAVKPIAVTAISILDARITDLQFVPPDERFVRGRGRPLRYCTTGGSTCSTAARCDSCARRR